MTVDYTSGAGPEQLKRLFSEALDDSDPNEEPASSSPLDLFVEKPGSQVGRYRLLSVLGEGGMGVVYLAEQEHPIKRQVALKVIKPGMDSKRVIARFKTERQTLALLDHPNIARVLDAGATANNRPYFVMEYVKGLPITQHCDTHHLTIEERLRLFLQVCHAVQHAHQKGIIHRDLKPSNIMVSLQDDLTVPKVIDFGVARAMGSSLTEHTLCTEQGHLVGTPAYMSPEQAELANLDVDTRTDIYSLGVLLYELLTGTVPFSEEQLCEAGYLELQRIIRDQEPTRPSAKLSTPGASLIDIAAGRQISPDSLKRSVRGDLDWIVMKCLEKDRTRRFETAHELAADLQRHLDHEPVVARPPSTAYRFQKAWRRNKVIYTAVAAVAIALVSGTGISMWQATEARRNEVTAQRRAYNSDMSLAFRSLQEHVFGRVQESVRQHIPKPGEPDFRGWEWRYAWAQSRSDAAFTWDTPADMDEVFAIRTSPDQRYLVSCEFNPGPWTGGFIRRLWNVQTREELKHIHLPIGSMRGFAFSNSGKYLALHRGPEEGMNDICVYDTSRWDLATTIPLEATVYSLSFSPDDKTIATIGDTAAILWDCQRQTIIHRWAVRDRGWHHSDVAFLSDGRWLALGGLNELQIVDARTGSIEHRQPAPDGGITALAISPDSRYVAIGAGYEIHEIGLLNTALWEREPPLTGHSGWVTSLAFLSDSQRLISSSTDNTIRVWDMNSRATTRVLKGHQSEVFSVLPTSDESRAVSSGKDKRILEWELNVPPPLFREYVLAEPVREVVFSPDSQLFYTVDDSGSVGIWDTKALAKRHSSSSKLGDESSIILSDDGGHLIAGNGLGQLWVLDARDFQVVAHRSLQSGRILPVGFSADGKSLVVLESGNKISFWNTETWQLRSRVGTGLNIQHHTAKNYCAIPQGSDMLLYPSGADLAWWDLDQSQELATLRINSRRSGVIAISPTEPLLASAARGDSIFLWDWKTRQSVGQLRGPRAVHSVAFSPDGQRLVSGTNGKGALMLWDVSTRQEIARLGTYVAPLLEAVQFSPDGNMICAVGNDGTAYFWRAPSFKQINALENERAKEEEAHLVDVSPGTRAENPT